MNKHKWTILSITLLLIAGGAFYWYGWRPSQIRKMCFRSAGDKVNENRTDFDKFLHPNPETNENFNNYYSACLHEKGI